ncbi:hypothetical protein NP493_402g02030 [Ridgeia piscesae]|uniref:Glycerol-3-phosphate dehydrogenase n=1 Tax=Ridgeia piscesae TaxID=27915 RepID=A0AAD9L2P0_RIDPI|nr:hypothetical protein NP493_402g02030 [Ridgeia piscesae]
MSRFRWHRRLALLAAVAVGGSAAALWTFPRIAYYRRMMSTGPKSVSAQELQDKIKATHLPTRAQQLAALQENNYDVLVIGGGATGCGVALDAVSRGLSTALLEKFDFASGTSSRSTKLIHGGVRYLQKAILGLDLEQFRMVTEALAERANLIEIAPHLAYPIPIMLPVYKLWQVPYFWVGIKAYDMVAGTETLKPSYFLSKYKALELFPMLKAEKLCGALVYYDGMHEDARMCLSIALTAARLGASVANHVEVIELLKSTESETGATVVSGARVRDTQTGKEWNIKAKCVVNATGPYTDFVRTMDDPKIPQICQPSSGVHIILPSYYSPAQMGLLDPSTSDGRIIFFLPWQNSTMAGTTDNPCTVTDNPTPTEAEIQFILKEIRNYLNPDVNVRRGDVLSAWSGIRPLVVNPNASHTKSIARNHIIEVSKTNLITIAGGKWTTYRSMAEETVDRAIEVCGLKPVRGCLTKGLLLHGAHGWTPTLFIRLIQDFGLDDGVAQHLANTYGDQAVKVAKLAKQTGKRWPVIGQRLHEDYPYIEAEIRYSVREYACKVVDVLARRTRLAFLNVQAAEEAMPRIIEIMAEELNWTSDRMKEEERRARRFLQLEMGLNLKHDKKNIPINFTKDEINVYINRFRSIDESNSGYITLAELRHYFKKVGEKVTEDQLHEILSDVDIAKNAKVDLGEFLQLMSALKTGAVSTSRFDTMPEFDDQMTEPISVDRSGGGV